MSKQRTGTAKETRWREIIKRQAASGLSIRGFCRQEQLRELAFYAWRRTIVESQPAASEPDFVPALVIGQSTDSASIALELPDGLVLRLPESMAAVRLAELVHALQVRGER